MKFARYLEETQIPEWKRAYLDYKLLKGKLSAIKHFHGVGKAPEKGASPAGSVLRDGLVDTIPPRAFHDPTPKHAFPAGEYAHLAASSPAPTPSPPGGSVGGGRTTHSPASISTDTLHGLGLPPAMGSLETLVGNNSSEQVREQGAKGADPEHKTLSSEATSGHVKPEPVVNHDVSLQRAETLRQSHDGVPLIDTTGRPMKTPKTQRTSLKRFTFTLQHRNGHHSAQPPVSIDDLLLSLNSVELEFFELLHQEIEKVDAFYKAREKDAILKMSALREQMKELRDHKKLLDEHRDGLWPGVLSVFSSANPKATKSTENLDESRPQSRERAHADRAARDPDAYRRAKKKLKKAVLEFYKSLEHLQNYRILNVTGFRKALKKFDKITKMNIQEQYMRERVDGRDFMSGETCSCLLKEVEQIYATQFAQGNEKKARGRLRAGPRKITHHFSTFRSGTWIGLSVPALVMAVYHLLQPEAREQVPEWHSLLQVYAALSIPIMFVLLIGLNLVAWARARINFVFIFGLDVRTVIDAKEYVELPAFLFTTLAYAFCMSFSLTGSDIIPSTRWPIIWVILALVTLFNPLPIFHRSARYWLLRTFGMLFLSGTRRVEFADFWLGDQFCSLVYTMSNMYFLICAYADHWERIEQRCQLEQHWTVPLVLSTIPFIIRFVQCIRRYIDSKHRHHLTNAVKYVASIIYYLTYYIWRKNDMDYDIHLAVFVTFATINSLFGAYWDYTMDWGVLQVQGAQYKLLRKELAYSGWIPAYYVAIVANVLIRFSWIGYIPRGGPPITTRSFIISVLEMFRRVQWNFFRLENEHIGNADQFRVTREIPLPYVFPGEEESDDEDSGSRPQSREVQHPKDQKADLEK
ncbi:unnamed protein product [Rhizoctonia solani]|uniref:Xenotropic and polytropic retrovirus receptor 1 n=1 Tax=Rhizoctonia solani TaxID=456999 RepID=A0A8H2XRK0_9AGAM|nr:unnamed protein product [Rhizoctonia solani]